MQANTMPLQKMLIYRVGAGKALGLAVGLIGFFGLPQLLADPSMSLRVGVLLWYPTMGAFIGLFGIFSKHPILNFSMSWWFRGALIGAWMNFVLTLIAYQQICTLMAAVFGEYSQFTSPYWMVLEGALIGMLMDFILSKLFGEADLNRL